MVYRENMAEAVCRFLDFNQEVYAIVFCRTKLGAKELADELNARGYPSDALHGDMSQDQRDLTMKKFKEKKINLLICTDVAARGIDVSDLTHVINFGLPQDNESYVHRIGRTGRGGKQGVALSIIEKSEGGRIAQIERITKAKIERIALPKVEEIKAVLLEKSFNQFSELLTGDFENEMFTNFKNRFEHLTASTQIDLVILSTHVFSAVYLSAGKKINAILPKGMDEQTLKQFSEAMKPLSQQFLNASRQYTTQLDKALKEKETLAWGSRSIASVEHIENPVFSFFTGLTMDKGAED
jgi:superfamily II DNA/RNA helicase